MSQTKRQVNRTWNEAERRKHGRQVRERFARDREEKLSQAKAIIDELLDQGVTVSQNEVARRTGISVGFVNKHLRGAVEQARQRQRQRSQKPRTTRSLAAVEKDNERLRVSNHRQQQELDKQRRINRELLAQVARVVDLEDEVALLRTQNRELLAVWNANQEKVVSLPTGMPNQGENTKQLTSSRQIESSLKALGVKLTSTLRRTIKAAPEETVLQAIEALKEALEKHEIKSPGGWLKSAIEGEWIANENLQQAEKSIYPEGFEDWYQKAVESGFVLDIPVNYLNLDRHNEPKVKVNRPGAFGAPYTEITWRNAKEEMLNKI